jgi:hypothetical protein
MNVAAHSMLNSLKSSRFHSTRQTNSQKGRAAKVKDGIISETKFLRPILVDRYTVMLQFSVLFNP